MILRFFSQNTQKPTEYFTYVLDLPAWHKVKGIGQRRKQAVRPPIRGEFNQPGKMGIA